MPGLLIETGKPFSMIGGGGIPADSTGKRYNGVAVGSTTGIDTMLYNECLVTMQTGLKAAGFTADLLASADTTGSNGTVVGTFGTLADSSLYTGYVYAVGQSRYFFLRTDGTTVAGYPADIQATCILATADRPATDASAAASFVVVK
jgi:hypothetical protein